MTDWKDMADWSGLPDVYVTKAECQDGIVWRIEACSVPMAIGPEVRLVIADQARADAAAAQARKTFPILKGEGAKIDYQLVADHAEQAKANHYQTVERLAERGGLSWCELYAVLHNRKWEKIETNEAMIACRALEARYLAALASDAGTAELAKLRERITELEALTSGVKEETDDKQS